MTSEIYPRLETIHRKYGPSTEFTIIGRTIDNPNKADLKRAIERLKKAEIIKIEEMQNHARVNDGLGRAVDYIASGDRTITFIIEEKEENANR